MPLLQRPIIEKHCSAKATVICHLMALAGWVTSVIRHRLYWRFCNLLAKAIRGQGDYCTVRVSRDGVMKIFPEDPYWSRLLAKSYHYEPDFEIVLRRLRDLDFAVLDCGANFGYWSILLSGEALGAHPVAAVEASPETFRILQENCVLNQNRFQCLHVAIAAESGHRVTLEAPNGHAGARIRENPLSAESTVSTLTLDDMALNAFGVLPERMLIKLDVEGQEIPAFSGARQLLARDVLFYYEDHGHDPQSRVTAYVLETLGLTVLFCREDGSLIPIQSVSDACQVKKRKTYGYNFFACKEDSAFLRRLQSVVSVEAAPVLHSSDVSRCRVASVGGDKVD